MKKNKTIFWVVGEKSGDTHASKIIAHLPQYHHFGIGGNMMMEKGFKPIFPFKKFAVMGVLDVIKNIRFFYKVKNEIQRIFLSKKIDAVVLVDYPGFNLKIAKIAKKFNLKVIYYICPKVWASRESRIKKLRKYTDKLLSILPFEVDYFKKFGLKVTFVGNPSLEQVKPKITKAEFAQKFGLNLNKKWIALFPGSRNSEVKKLLPVFIALSKLLIKREYEVIISKADSVNSDFLYTENIPRGIKIISQFNYDMMEHSDFLVVKSGTTTLEAAITKTPFLIVYKTDPLFYNIVKKIIKIPYIGLPNIITNSLIIKEFIQKKAEPKALFNHIEQNLSCLKKYQTIQDNLNKVKELLKGNSETPTASNEIKKIIETP